MKITRTIKFAEYVLGYIENMELHEVTRIEKVGRLGRNILKEESEKCGHKLMILNTVEHEKKYECTLEDFLSVAKEIKEDVTKEDTTDISDNDATVKKEDTEDDELKDVPEDMADEINPQA